MDAIFGMEFPLLIKFVISFAIVLILIGAAAFLVRRFGGRALIGTTQRGQQPRLAVVDTAAIDSRRSLVIVRRDNVEHLLLIGGPTDLLVEPNIARAAASRDVETPARGAEPAAANWSTRGPIEPAPRFESAVRNEPAFLPELAQRIEPDVRTQPVPAFEPASAISAPRSNIQFQPAQAATSGGAPRDKLNGSGHQTHSDSLTPKQAPASPQIPADVPEVAASDDQSLANMAQRLETALRRPLSGALRATPAPAARPATNQTQPALDQPHPAPAPAASPVVVPALDAVAQLPAAASATAQSIRTETATYENLQREMASLLGRKPGSS
jgi:flagellar protein FliO/FliZ